MVNLLKVVIEGVPTTKLKFCTLSNFSQEEADFLYVKGLSAFVYSIILNI